MQAHVVGSQLQPLLAAPKTFFLGNKNKTGSFDGEYIDANINDNAHSHVENCGDSLNVIDTVLLDQQLYQKCNLNSTDPLGQEFNTGDLTYTSTTQARSLVSYQKIL